MAVEHAEHVARLQHVLQQATEKARKAGGRPACITATIFMEVEVPDRHEARSSPPPPPRPLLPPRPPLSPRTRAAHARSVHRPLEREGPRPRPHRFVPWQAAALLEKIPVIMGALQTLVDADDESFADIPLTSAVIEQVVQSVLPELPLEVKAAAFFKENAAAGQVVG